MKKAIAAEDIGLRFRIIEERGYMSVESDSMILEDSIAEAVQKAARNIGMKAAPTMVLLANEINARNAKTRTLAFRCIPSWQGWTLNSPRATRPIRLNDAITSAGAEG
ncbi:MAG: hypothetical protein U0936_22560 [Planctomycetaceae bacterium]